MSQGIVRWLAWGTWTLILALLVFVLVLGGLNDIGVAAEEFFLVPLVLLATIRPAHWVPSSPPGSRAIP